jgi:hypothetical protein|nr:MAG TPA: hypothetical protein [Caudoviricetes sp.]
MLGVSEVTYTYATVTCNHPGCNNRINLQPGPEDSSRELRDLKTLRGLGARQGWLIDDSGYDTECPYHNRKEEK